MPNSLPYHKPLKFVDQERNGGVLTETYERGNIIIDLVLEKEIVNVTLVPFNYTVDMKLSDYEKLCYLGDDGRMYPTTQVLTEIIG